MNAYSTLRFTCPNRHRSFLDRFRIPTPDGHRPTLLSRHNRQVEWAEFRGTRMCVAAGRCVDCDLPIVSFIAGQWGVRMHDDHEGEQAFADALNAGTVDMLGRPTAVPTSGRQASDG